MLPFKKEEASVTVPNQTIRRTPDNEKEYDPMHDAMREFGDALSKKDYATAAEIFRSSFELLDSEPHVEGPHLNGGDE